MQAEDDDDLLLCQYEENAIEEAAQQLSLTRQEDAAVIYKLSTGLTQIKVRELRFKGLSFQIWPAAHALCWYLEKTFGQTGMIASPSPCAFKSQKPSICRNMRVLELGAGTGLVGILCAVLGAHTTITDLPHVIPNLEHNANVNQDVIESSGLGGSVTVKMLRWGEQADFEAIGRSFDLIVASDVVYYDHLYEPLICTLRWLLLAPRCWSESIGKPARRIKNGDKVLTSNNISHENGASSHVCAIESTAPLPPCDDRDAIRSEGVCLEEVVSASGAEEMAPTVLLAHIRRWKKDSQFFKRAAKLFQVSVVHKQSHEANSRTGVTVYSFSKRRN